MLSLKVSQCDKRLNFSPAKTWPVALPAIAWKGWLLAGFDRSEGPAIDIASLNMPFVAAFTSCYPQLSLSELSRFFVLAQKAELTVDWDEYFSHYGLRFNENLQGVLTRLPTCPESFQAWVTEKDLGVRDLAILRSFEDLASVAPLLESLSRLAPSKSTGVETLEWALELFLMKRDLAPSLPTAEETAEAWHQRLRRLRHPETEQAEDAQKKKFLSLPWPSLSQIRWVRKGDDSGLEIRFMVSSSADLKKKLKGLEHVQKIMDEQMETDWQN